MAFNFYIRIRKINYGIEKVQKRKNASFKIRKRGGYKDESPIRDQKNGV